MKLATYELAGSRRVGAVLDGDRIVDLAAVAGRLGATEADLTALGSMQALIEAGKAGLAAARTAAGAATDAEIMSLGGVTLLAPLPRPVQMRDCMLFEKHLRQGSEWFLRDSVKNAADPDAAFQELLSSGIAAIPQVWYEQPVYYKCNRFSVIGPGADVQWPSYSNMLDYELELAMVIGREGRNITKADAPAYIFGYTIYNDVSARDAQFREMAGRLGPAKGKDFDTGNILGPWIVTADEFDPYGRTMLARVNGIERSRGNSGEMHHRFEDVIAHISRDETLYPGEVIGSGTVGNGCGAEFGRYLSPGDVVELEIEGIGVLRNRMVRRQT